MAAMQEAVGRGWRAVGRPAVGLAAKLWATQRLDLVVAITLEATLPPGGLAVFLSRAARLVVAARVAHSVQHSQTAADEEDSGSGGGGSSEGGEGSGQYGAPPPAGPAGCADGGRAAGGRPRASKRQPPKGMGGGGLPPLVLPLLPPGSLACCSAHPAGAGLPMLFEQLAAGASFYVVRANRLRRGLAGLAAMLLLCRPVRMPFTGRLACLPPRCVEVAYSWLGLASAALYPARAAGRGSGSDHHVACEASAPILQHLYSCLRAAGEEEAARGGRAVAFAGPSAESVHAIPSTRTGATCLPGGIVFVHSGLLRCIWGRTDCLAFVLGHELGHALGRHSLEQLTSLYLGQFAVDAVLGLAERLLQGLAPPVADGHRWAARRLRSLDGLLQGGLYLLQLGASRAQEYEADLMGVELGAAAGLERRSLLSGAADVFRMFAANESSAYGRAAVVKAGQPDHLLSTHPAAVNRLARLSGVPGQ